MKTLWDKGAAIDDQIAVFTVGDDRDIDAHLAVQDVQGSLAHVRTLLDAGLLTPDDAHTLTAELVRLLALARAGELRPEPQDEDIHSAVERKMTERLGTPAKRVHTARSRNDQVATDVALWMRTQLLEAHAELLTAVNAASAFAAAHADRPLPGMTHLQPAMPSTFGLWALGYGALLLDDAHLLRAAFEATDACPLGSAAGYGMPARLAPLDRASTATRLAFSRPVEPVTAVQAGRGKGEASVLFAFAQLATTCSRLAADIVLYVNPHFGWLALPDAFTTGSSIMPQKKNPDVMELVRGHVHGIHAALFEVMSLPAGMPGGYHRDFQLLKAPLLRGVQAGRAVIQIVGHVLAHLTVNADRALAACTPELYATHRALELVAAGTPFRDAYRQVAAEVAAGTLPSALATDLPDTTAPLTAVASRLTHARTWHADHAEAFFGTLEALGEG